MLAESSDVLGVDSGLNKAFGGERRSAGVVGCDKVSSSEDSPLLLRRLCLPMAPAWKKCLGRPKSEVSLVDQVWTSGKAGSAGLDIARVNDSFLTLNSCVYA